MKNVYIDIVNQTHTANIYGVFENDERIGTVQVVLIGPNCGARAFSDKGKYSKRDILNLYRYGNKRIKLFNELFEYYGTEHATWQAVQKALDNNLTAAQVKKIF